MVLSTEGKIASTVGLILDIFGVALTLWAVLFPLDTEKIEGLHKPPFYDLTVDSHLAYESRVRSFVESKNFKYVRLGVILIVIGFLLQILGIWYPNENLG